MGKSCSIVPVVKNSKGEEKSSKLYQSLLDFTSNNRELSTEIWSKTRTDKFKNDWLPKLKTDENGEATMKSLLDKTNISKYIDEQAVLKKLNKDIGYYKKGEDRPALHKKTDANRKALINKAIEFNKNSEYNDKYVANVITTYDSQSNNTYINVKVSRRDQMLNVDARNMEANESLNNKLESILANWGIGIGVISEAEERLGINGVADFSQANTLAEGLIELIRLAKGEEGRKALPEEFAHVAIEMLGDNPLSSRLINALIDNGMVEQILGDSYEKYRVAYDNDTYKLAKEAAGKLLAEHLNFIENQSKVTKFSNLVSRMWASIKNLLSKLNEGELQKAINDTKNLYSSVARDILNGSLDSQVSLDNITKNDSYYSLQDRVERDKNILSDIIDTELKRLKIYAARNPGSTFEASQKLKIDKLEIDLITNQELEGIFNYIEEAVIELGKVGTRLDSISDPNNALPLNQKASILRDVGNYISSYGKVASELREALLEEEAFSNNRYGQRVRVALDQLTILMQDLQRNQEKVVTPLFAKFLQQFNNGSPLIQMSRNPNDAVPIEELIREADRDISFYDRWLSSMADSTDAINRLLDQAVKKSKELARLATVKTSKEIQAMQVELEQAGVKNTEFMYETLDGEDTGFYISEIHRSKFEKAKEQFFKYINEKYTDDEYGLNEPKKLAEISAWYKDNIDTKTGKPLLSKYKNEEFYKLNAAQKKYYNKFMDIKKSLNGYLYFEEDKAYDVIKIRKDMFQRVMDTDGGKGKLSQLKAGVKDNFVRRSDDTEFGSSLAVQDFKGKVVHTLPVYYTSMKEGESYADLSHDASSTLLAFAGMANNFNEMNKVIDVLELGRDLLRERVIKKSNNGKKVEESFKILGRKVTSVLKMSAEESNVLQRLEDFFEMQVYNKYIKDEGTFLNTNIDKAKVADFINGVTAMNNLALNLLSGISNVTTGNVMMQIEAASSEFFTVGQLAKADTEYLKEMPGLTGEIGSRVHNNKLALFNELFNILQEYDSEVRDADYGRSNRFSKLLKTNSLFFLSNAGEHWMQSRTGLSLAQAYKMKDTNGNEVTLWDSLEVVPTDANNRKLGSQIRVKPGYTKIDGTQFTDEDIIAFGNRSKAINQKMHGIYNQIDRSAVQRLALGRMAMMYRKWIVPSLSKRFAIGKYNYDLQSFEEGYYRTSYNFLKEIRKDLANLQFSLMSEKYSKLSKNEKANIKRAITETGIFVMVAMLLGFIDWPDDRKKSPWAVRLAEYQMRRLYTELGVLIPGPTMFQEGLTIIKSPAAGINTIENISNMIGLFNPYNYSTELKSGRYKGHSKAFKLVMESPLLPMNKTIYKGLHPETGVAFYKK